MNILKYSHIKYGLIMCFLLIVCLLLMDLSGQSFDNKSPLQAIFMYLAPFVIWYFGIKAKKQQLSNKLTYKQGLTEGFKISLVYAIISPFIFMAYYLLFNLELVDYARTAYGLGDASNTTVIIVDMIVQFIVAIIFGTIYGAIVSFFLKTKS